MIVLTVAAAEAAIGLAILVTFFRNRGDIAVDDASVLMGLGGWDGCTFSSPVGGGGPRRGGGGTPLHRRSPVLAPARSPGTARCNRPLHPSGVPLPLRVRRRARGARVAALSVPHGRPRPRQTLKTR
jgi:hypothetical protein